MNKTEREVRTNKRKSLENEISATYNEKLILLKHHNRPQQTCSLDKTPPLLDSHQIFYHSIPRGLLKRLLYPRTPKTPSKHIINFSAAKYPNERH